MLVDEVGGHEQLQFGEQRRTTRANFDHVQPIGHRSPGPPGRRDAAAWAERAERILGVAAELLIADDTVVIDTVARAAGVGKGTIYLHFRSRDALLAAVLRRERLLLAEGLTGDTPGEVAGAAAGELRRRPLVVAVLRRGELPAGVPGDPRGAAAGFARYLAELQSAGLVRADRPAAELTVAVAAVLIGHLTIADTAIGLPADAAPALIAETVDRLLDTGRALDDAARAEVARATGAYLARGRAEAATAFYETAGIAPPEER